VTSSTENKNFDKDTVIERSIGAESVEVGDDTVIVDSLHGRALRLNSTGTAIWRELGSRPSYAQLVRHLAENFPVGPDGAEEALQSYLSDLLDQGLIGTSRVVRVITDERNPA